MLREATARAIPGGTATYAASKVLPGLAALVSVVVFLRLAGADAYGVYSVAMAVAVFAGNLALGWLRQGALRYAGDAALSPGALPSWATWTSVSFACLATAAVVPLAHSAMGFWTVLGAAAVAGALGYQSLVVTVLQSRIAPAKVLQAEALRAVLQFSLPCAFVILLRPSGAVLLWAVALAAVSAVLPFRRVLTPLAAESGDRQMHGPVLRMWWGYGWPLSLWLSVATVLQLSDRVLIARWVGNDAAGAYAGLYDVVTGGFSICLFPLTMAAQPVISTLWNQGRRRAALEENRRALRAQVAIFVPVCLFVLVARDALVAIVLPASARRYGAVVMPVLLGAFLWQLALTVHKRLELERRSATMLVFILIATLANLGANAALIPAFGALAAGWTTLGSAALYLGLCLAWRAGHRFAEVDGVA